MEDAISPVTITVIDTSFIFKPAANILRHFGHVGCMSSLLIPSRPYNDHNFNINKITFFSINKQTKESQINRKSSIYNISMKIVLSFIIAVYMHTL